MNRCTGSMVPVTYEYQSFPLEEVLIACKEKSLFPSQIVKEIRGSWKSGFRWIRTEQQEAIFEKQITADDEDND